ncbi:pirin family protein [Aliiglaciecola sp.]|nr:pirin family protein [Aliiglaciecola sp.]
MSTVSNDVNQQQCDKKPCDAVTMVIHPKEKELGGFSVRRVLPYAQQRMVGPWIFFDHMGPAQFPAGDGINVRPHPHINLATVTYLFEGEILHRDSLGSLQAIKPGDINLMVAGKGIVHSERERPEIKAQDHQLHGLQLWMALPEKDEEIEPAFYHYPEADIPHTQVNDVPIRVMIGQAYGIKSPVKTFANTLYIEADVQCGQSLVLPEAQERAVYVASGKVDINGAVVEQYQMAVIAPGKTVCVEAIETARIAVIGGEKMAPRHMFWNFASSSKERIEQAKLDWQEGRFPKVPGDEDEFIPLP